MDKKTYNQYIEQNNNIGVNIIIFFWIRIWEGGQEEAACITWQFDISLISQNYGLILFQSGGSKTAVSRLLCSLQTWHQ